MSQGDNNIPETNVGVEITGTGFSASAKSRFIAAIDRLLGNFVDLPNPSIEAFNGRRRARAEVREALIRRSGEMAIRKIEADDEAINLVVDRMLSEEIRKQDNKERVAQMAIEDLREDPPKDDDGFNEDEFIDWMNVFSRYAEDASSERLQQLWAKVLAGQIRKNRAFSFGTLRLLSELDPAVAESFQDALEYTIREGALVVREGLEGDELLRWRMLEDVGFISGVDGLKFDLVVKGDGEFVLPRGDYIVHGKSTPETKIPVMVKMLTQAGLEVASILPKPSYQKAVEALVEQYHILESSSELHIGRVISRQEVEGRKEAVRVRPYKTIKGPVPQ